MTPEETRTLLTDLTNSEIKLDFLTRMVIAKAAPLVDLMLKFESEDSGFSPKKYCYELKEHNAEGVTIGYPLGYEYAYGTTVVPMRILLAEDGIAMLHAEREQQLRDRAAAKLERERREKEKRRELLGKLQAEFEGELE